MPEPWFSSSLDGMTPSGIVTISSSGAPVTSSRAFQVAGVETATSPVLPERTSGSAGFSAAMSNVSDASGILVTYLGTGGANRLRVTRTGASNTHAFQYWNGSAWVTVGTTFTILTSTMYQVRIEWSGFGTSSGSVSMRMFIDGGEAPLASRSATGINFTGISGIVQVVAASPLNSQDTRYSVFFICDNNGDTSYVYTSVANANGADTNGTGDFNSINDTGTNYDSTFISLPVSGNRRSVKNTANRNYNSRRVRAVSVNARLRRGSTGPTQARVYLTIGGVRYYHPTTLSLTTAFVPYVMVWETDPSTSAPWTLTNAEAASLEWGVEAL